MEEEEEEEEEEEVHRNMSKLECYLSDLPTDLLPAIFNRLSFLDRLSFRAVCKAWWSAAPIYLLTPKQAAHPTPWIMLFEEFTGETRHALFDLSRRELHPIDIPDLCPAQCLASRHGWLLLLSRPASSMFFLNPITKARIELPYLKSYIDTATFTAPPTSKDCMVFAINCAPFFREKIQAFVCRRGNDSWSSYSINKKGSGMITQVVFCREIFYCRDHTGMLATFNPNDGAWDVLFYGSPTIRDLHFIEFDGDIYMVPLDRYGLTRFLPKLETHKPLRLELKRLQNGMMLLGLNNSSVSLRCAEGKEMMYVSKSRAGFKCVVHKLNGQDPDVILGPMGFDRHHTPLWIEPKWVPPSLSLSWTS